MLWKNRLLPLLSMFVFFGGLRRLGASLAVSAGGTALLFFNFLSPLNASSFSTTSSNMLIWLLALLALFDAHAAKSLGARSLAWILSSSLLVAAARFEFLPASLFILAAVLYAKPAGERKALLRPANLLLIAAGACLLALWSARALAPGPARQLNSSFRPAANFAAQLGTHNLAILAGQRPREDSGALQRDEPEAAPAAAALAWLFLLVSAAGILLGALGGGGRSPGLAVPLFLWIFYFSAIYGPPDFYPLHFMRHHLYFLVPLAYLFTLGLAGFESAAARLGRSGAFAVLLAVLAAAYAGLNAKTALAFNGELRTNDRELALLLEAQRRWEPGCLAVHPKLRHDGTRADLIAKYFPVLSNCAAATAACALKYVSPEPYIFPGAVHDPLARRALEPGEGAPWRTASFNHAFYTILGRQPGNTGMRETDAPVPLTIGFFRMGREGRDRAFLDSAAGACAFSAGDHAEANRRFRSAAAADPSCLNCKYFLAATEAALGRPEPAEELLKKIDAAAAGALTPAHRELVRALAARDLDRAAALAGELWSRDPDFFLRENFAAGIRPRGRP